MRAPPKSEFPPAWPTADGSHHGVRSYSFPRSRDCEEVIALKVLVNLSGENSGWLRPSRNLGNAIKPILEALVLVDQMFLRTHHCPPLYKSGVRYKEEPMNTATLGHLGTPQRIEEFAAIPAVVERGWGDCFPRGTLVLAEGHRLVPVETVAPGDKIWGGQDWTSVVATAFKGELDVSVVQMNNGSELSLTRDHHVFVLECPEHGHQKKLCSCEPRARREVKVRVSELVPGMVLAAPEQLPFGKGAGIGADRAHVEGLYVADGWSDKPSRFCISGKDGHPKEEQKSRVKAICESLGMNTRWNDRYIAVNDGDWALRMQLMGTAAPNKHLLSLDLDESEAIATIGGVMADSGKNTRGPGRTFSTTSRTLAVQTRILHKMVGMTCGWRRLEDHGGLGTHPIYRLNVRQKNVECEMQEKLLRVKAVDHEAFRAPCWDLQTADHHVYLPEHDVTVSNCDDLSPWRVAELREHGEPAKIRIQWKKHPETGQKLFHIVVRRADGSIEDPSLLLGMR